MTTRHTRQSEIVPTNKEPGRILPLESCYPSPKHILNQKADVAVRIAIKALRRDCVTLKIEKEVAVVPGALEALKNMNDVIRVSERLIRKAAARLEQVAEYATTDHINPYPARENVEVEA